MATQTPLTLEFNYHNMPHPAGSTNKTTIRIFPSGDMKPVLGGYSMSLGSGDNLTDTLRLAADLLLDDVKKQTSGPLSNKIYFTDDQGLQTVFSLNQP